MPRLQDLADEISTVLGTPITLEDRAFRLLAFAAQTDSADAVRRETILARGVGRETRAWFESHGIRRASGPVWIPARTEPDVAPRLCLPVRSGRAVLGYAWAIAEGHVTEDALPPQDPRLAAAMLLTDEVGVLLARGARAGAQASHLIADLMDAPVSQAISAADRLAALVGMPRGPIRVLLADTSPANRAPGALRTSDVVPRGAAMSLDGDLLTVLLPSRGEAETRAVAERLSTWFSPDGRSVPVGVGGEVAALSLAGRSRDQAETALSAAVAQAASSDLPPGSAQVAEWDALGVQRLLGQSWAPEVGGVLSTPGIRALLEPRHADLRTTAQVFLDEAGSVAAVSRRLGLHRQGVYHRLGRIAELTGLDLADGRDRLHLHLALVLGGEGESEQG